MHPNAPLVAAATVLLVALVITNVLWAVGVLASAGKRDVARARPTVLSAGLQDRGPATSAEFQDLHISSDITAFEVRIGSWTLSQVPSKGLVIQKDNVPSSLIMMSDGNMCREGKGCLN
jgi:hypothetical protein